MAISTRSGAASGLRSECLSFRETLAQSIANIAPTATPTINAPLVFASAGKGMWLAYLIATIGLVLVGMSINQFARRSASPGSLYAYIARGLGPTVGVLSGWGLVIAYLLTAMAVLCGFSNYSNVLVSLLGFQIAPIFLFALCAGLCWYFAYKDIQLSTVLMLGLEAVSIGMILILAIVVLAGHGFTIDLSQLSLEGASSEGIRLGLVLAVFSYVGYESATALGDEAKEPLTTIPRAVVLSAVLAGTFFVIISYVEVLGFSGSDIPLDKSDAPLSVLANLAGVGFFGPLISIGALISFFACALASINAGGRILFSMARHGIFHSSMGQPHRLNETPHIAVTMSSLIVFLIPASMSLFGVKVLEIYGYLGTIATYGFLMTYILISVAAPVYLYRERALKIGDIVLAVLSVLFMLVPVVGSVYPTPPSPFNVFPYLFLMFLLVGATWFFLLRLHSPEIIDEMEGELEAIHTRFSDLKKV
ncbi:APC family permease [Leptolyngbya sp. FACHB-261]|uniref:APC family permease n=1 Tax=Leptolyngbya sp. FACHB-261 TaxID=2692806 RepID=UPI0016894F2B|nr:APC family permease [Leptolyngbya sp. FACHB-261]MBD2102559.1 APC family permease [Leptolyngbya sp. FACHB-261]